MIRPDAVLHDVPVHRWTPNEAFDHLQRTFERAVAERPDLLESYCVRLADETVEAVQAAIIREALAATFTRRFPDVLARKAAVAP